MCIRLFNRLYVFIITRTSMGSHVLDILRQGIWASLTGGWFFDPHQSIFCNTFHLYLWLFFMCLPLTLHLVFYDNLIAWTVYCIVIGASFTIIKAFNHRLHHMFDTSEVIEETSSEDASDEHSDKNEDPSKTSDNGLGKFQSVRETSEGIEMQTLSNTNDQHQSFTPPVQCSSRNSVSDDDNSRKGSVRRGPTPADSMEYINKLIKDDIRKPRSSRSSLHELKVDVHRKDSQGSSRGASAEVDTPTNSARSNASTDGSVPGTLETVEDDLEPNLLSTIITPYGSPGQQMFGDKIIYSKKKTREILNSDNPRENQIMTVSEIVPLELVQSHSQSLSQEICSSSGDHKFQLIHEDDELNSFNLGHRIKPRLARKAVRRVKSSLESRPERKPPYFDHDPREPQNLSLQCSPYNYRVHRDRRDRQSLPEEPTHRDMEISSNSISKYKSKHKHVSSGNKGKSQSQHRELDVELSSPSSYKETSPECEVVDMFDFHNKKLDELDSPEEFHRSKSAKTFIGESGQSSSRHSEGVLSDIEFRSRAKPPINRSLDNNYRSAKSKAQLRRRKNNPSQNNQNKEVSLNHLVPKQNREDPFSKAVDMILSPVAKEPCLQEKDSSSYSLDSLPQSISPHDSSLDSTLDQSGSQDGSVILNIKPFRENTAREPARVTFREFSPDDPALLIQKENAAILEASLNGSLTNDSNGRNNSGTKPILTKLRNLLKGSLNTGGVSDEPSPAVSQQSSTVGLDWLFSTDTDSSFDESIHVSPASSTTLTFDDDVDSRDGKTKQLQRKFQESPPSGGKSSRSNSLDNKPVMKKESDHRRSTSLDTTSRPVTPPPDYNSVVLSVPMNVDLHLDTQRAQGAIPKKKKVPTATLR